MSLTFAAQLDKMITAGLGGAVDAPATHVAVGYHIESETVSGNPVTFSDGDGIASLLVSFSPVQAEGTPSPDNVLPITGWSEIHVYHGADQSDYETLTASFGSTYYAGTIDLVSGVGSVTKVMLTFDGSSDENWSISSQANGYRCANTLDAIYENVWGSTASTYGMANYLSAATNAYSGQNGYFALASNKTLYVSIDDSTITDTTTLRSYLADNPLQIVLTLLEPISFTLSAQTLATLAGDNVIWTDGDSLTVSYRKICYTEGY